MSEAKRELKTYRYRIYPTPAQLALMLQWQNALRFLWNLALEQYKIGMSRPRGERIYPTAYDQMRELTQLRAENDWLAAVPRDCAEALLLTLEQSWKRCFGRLARAPRWKRKSDPPAGFGSERKCELTAVRPGCRSVSSRRKGPRTCASY